MNGELNREQCKCIIKIVSFHRGPTLVDREIECAGRAGNKHSRSFKLSGDPEKAPIINNIMIYAKQTLFCGM